MNKNIPTLTAGILSLVLCSATLAQTGQADQADETNPVDLEQVASPQDEQTGLRVEERRYENRLDGVTVQHGEDGLQDYYDFNDPGIQRREGGGIVEGGAMRTWRLGVGGAKK